MNHLERLRETVQRTMSPHYNRPVPVQAVVQHLEAIVAMGDAVDRIKRALFYVNLAPDGREDSMPDLDQSQIYLLNGIIGLLGEAAELASVGVDLLKGLPVDRTNAIEEVGDITWYADLVLQSLDSTYEEALDANDAKLKARFKDKFNLTEREAEDKLAERQAMEKHLNKE